MASERPEAYKVHVCIGACVQTWWPDHGNYSSHVVAVYVMGTQNMCSGHVLKIINLSSHEYSSEVSQLFSLIYTPPTTGSLTMHGHAPPPPAKGTD